MGRRQLTGVPDGATAVDTTNDTLITQSPANAESTATLETEVRPSWWFVVSGSTVGNR